MPSLRVMASIYLTKKSMSQTVLLTAAQEDSEEIIALLTEKEVELIHAPLEVYELRQDDSEISNQLKNFDRFENIVQSSIRNARFFLEQVERYEKMEAVKNCLNLTFNEDTFAYLEDRGIPAVQPPNGDKPIDLVELMLRLQRMGKTLYPCGSHQREDFPGFLEELDIDVVELDVFDLEGPGEDELGRYRENVNNQPPEVVIFHSRRSVNRTLVAFPDLDYGQIRIISADKGITEKLKQKGFSADAEAEGSWASVATLVK